MYRNQGRDKPEPEKNETSLGTTILNGFANPIESLKKDVIEIGGLESKIKEKVNMECENNDSEACKKLKRLDKRTKISISIIIPVAVIGLLTIMAIHVQQFDLNDPVFDKDLIKACLQSMHARDHSSMIDFFQEAFTHVQHELDLEKTNEKPNNNTTNSSSIDTTSIVNAIVNAPHMQRRSVENLLPIKENQDSNKRVNDFVKNIPYSPHSETYKMLINQPRLNLQKRESLNTTSQSPINIIKSLGPSPENMKHYDGTEKVIPVITIEEDGTMYKHNEKVHDRYFWSRQI